jgi:hypothetical protein
VRCRRTLCVTPTQESFTWQVSSASRSCSALAALVVPLAASAHGGHGRADRDERHRDLYATDTGGNLLSFEARPPRRVRSTAITGLPAGVALRGIDFRPATGDLSTRSAATMLSIL